MVMLRLGIFVSLILFVTSKSTQKATKSALGPPQPRNNSKTEVCKTIKDCEQQKVVKECPKDYKCLAICLNETCVKSLIPTGCRSSKDCVDGKMCIKRKCTKQNPKEDTNLRQKPKKFIKLRQNKNKTTKSKTRKRNRIPSKRIKN